MLLKTFMEKHLLELKKAKKYYLKSKKFGKRKVMSSVIKENDMIIPTIVGLTKKT